MTEEEKLQDEIAKLKKENKKIKQLLYINDLTCPDCGAPAEKLKNGLLKCSNWDCENFAN